MKLKLELLKALILGAISLSYVNGLMASSPQEKFKDSNFVQDDIAHQNLDSQKLKPNYVLIKGIQIDLNNVPFDRKTDINLNKTDTSENHSTYPSQEGYYKAEVIFVTENKKFILYASSNQIPAYESFTSRLEFYNDKGKLLWKSSVDLDVYDCKISEDGKYVHLICNNPFSNETCLITYIEEGKELNRIIGVQNQFVPNSLGDIIYYEMLDKKSNVFGCLNYRNNSFWEKSLPDRVYIRAVATDSGDVIVSSDKTMYSYSSIGKFKWKKESENIYGDLDISMNASFFVWLQSINKFSIFDNLSGKELFSMDNVKYNSQIRKFIFVDFIKNTEIIYFTEFKGKSVNFVCIDLKGNFKKEIVINKLFVNTFKIIGNMPNEIELYYDGLIVKRCKI